MAVANTLARHRAGAPSALAGVDLRLIPSFVALAEELHFGRAAERLLVAQPALSRQLQRLEAQVGCELFVRDRRHVELSAAGRALLEPARRALALLESGLGAAAHAQRGDARTLRVGLSSAARDVLAPTLEHALVHLGVPLGIEWHEGFSAALLADVRAGTLDAALTFCAEPAEELTAVRVASDDVAVALHVHDELAGRERLAGPELAGHRLLVPPFSAGSPGYLWAVQRIWRDWTGCAPVVERARTALYTTIPGPGIARIVTSRFTLVRSCEVVTVPVDGGHALPFDLHARADDHRAAVRELLACAGALEAYEPTHAAAPSIRAGHAGRRQAGALSEVA